METKPFLLLLVAALIAAALFGFIFEESQKFYYGFNEKISLIEVENKLVVRYSESLGKNNISSDLRRMYPAVQQTWEDERTVVLSTSSKTERNVLMENLRSTPNVSSCQPMFSIDTGLEMIITDEIVVKFKNNISVGQQEEINQKFGVTLLKDGDTYLLFRVPKSKDALSIANQYQESGFVEFSHPNFIIQVEKHQQVIPNDPYFVNQFTLNNTGQVFNDGHFGTADADIDAPEAWAMTTSVNNILVAVLDEGISPNHPDLPNARQVRLNGSNFADGNPNDPSPTGNANHGNACAGVIAATQNNNEGIAGICTNCRIMPIRIFNTNPDIGLTPAQLADAINFARNNGADIISNSWGFNSDNPNFQPVIVSAIQNAITQGRMVNGVARGCVVLFSAGNNARQNQGDNGFVSFPSNVNIQGVLTVGASDRTDLQSDYSPTSNPVNSNNQIIDIVAPSHRAYPPTAYQPGVPGGILGETFEAWSIDIPGNTGYNPWPAFTSPGRESVVPPAVGEQLPNAGANFQAYTGRFGGTSHSCPVVAGVAALVLSANPNLTQQQVFDIITGTADRVGGYVYTNGRSNELGFGRVNACNALLETYRVGNQILGSGLVCSTANYSLQNAPNPNRISWSSSIPTGLSINPTTGAATRLNNFNGSVNITATINSGCGNSVISRTVWVGTPQITNMRVNNMSYFTGMNVQLCPGNHWLNVTPVGGNPGNASWTVPSGIPHFVGTNTLDFTYPQNYSNSLTISVRASNACGQGANSNFFLSKKTFGCTSSFSMVIYPNPAKDQFSVEMMAVDKNAMTEEVPVIESAVLLDKEGREITLGTRVAGKMTFEVSNLRKGIYFIHVVVDGELTREQIIIE